MPKLSNTNPQEETSQLIKKAVQRIHDKDSGDYQSLLRDVNREHRRIKKVTLNLPQTYAMHVVSKVLFLLWSRRTGKTTFRGYRWAQLNKQMPRSTGMFIGPTYQFTLTTIIPSIIRGLELFGYYKDLHYFIGRRPPRSWRNSWPEAYMPPDRYDHYITFWTGLGIHLVSQDSGGGGRGATSDWLDADEMSILNENKITDNVKPTMSGTNVSEFRNKPLFASELYTGTVSLTPEGAWYEKYEEIAYRDPKAIAFISANCLQNKENLRPGYLEEARRTSVEEWRFNAEYLNIRPEYVKGGFYHMFDKNRHQYTDFDYSFYTQVGQQADCRGDRDLTRGVPLILGVDWGGKINSLTANQFLKSMNEYRTLKSMYVLGEDQKMQDDLFIDFNKYYQYHDNKTIYLHYDNQGNITTGNTRQTRAEQARKQLTALGWKVILMTIGGRNVDHELKYRLWEMILKENDPRLPRYRMNKANCKELYISMKNAKTKQGRNGRIEKDKRIENSQVIPRQHATDLSDANDTPIYNMFKQYLYGYGNALPPTKIIQQ